jgi:uncharacterized protein
VVAETFRRDGAGAPLQTGSIMKLPILLAFAVFAASPAFAEDAVGIWYGSIQTTKGDRPILATIKQADGRLITTLESPTQAPGVTIPTENVVCDGTTLSFASTTVSGAYSAKWDAGRKAWVGVWKQNGVDMPMELMRTP